MDYKNGVKHLKKHKSDKYYEDDHDDETDDTSDSNEERDQRYKLKQKYKEKEGSSSHKYKEKKDRKSRSRKDRDLVKSYKEKDKDVEKSYRDKSHRHKDKRHSRSPSSRHHRSRSRSKNRSRSRSHSRRRSRSGSRHKSRPWHSPTYKKKFPYDDKRYEPPYSSRASKPSSEALPFIPNKSQRKMMILEKLGIDLVVPGKEKPQAGTVAAKQEVTPYGAVSGELAAYCNLNAANSKQIMERIARKKVLWQNKTTTEQKPANVESTSASSSASSAPKSTTGWQSAIFAKDTDNKQTAKFKRLMGIREGEDNADTSKFISSSTDKDVIKRQEEMFQNMEMQYEVARASTHTHRGIGLGFGIHQYPR